MTAAGAPDGPRRGRTATLLVWLLTCAIWSTVWLFIKVGVSDVPPVTFAAYRVALAFLVLAPLTLARGAALPRRWREWRLIGATGVLVLGANYAAVYWGAQFIPSGLTAVLQAMTPAFSMVLGHLVVGAERATPGQIGALALGIVGVSLIFVDQLQLAGWMSLWGSAAVLCGALFVALGYLLVKDRGGHLSPGVIVSGQMLAAVAPLTALAAVAEGNPLAVRWTPASLVALVYLVVLGSVVATWLNYWLLRRMSATHVLVMALVEPPLAMMLGAVLLDEALSGRILAGSACVLVSVALVLEIVPRRRG